MLVPMRAILEAADKHRYGQGAFNMNSVGQVEAAVRIHELLDSPAILQGAEASNAYLGGAADFMHGSIEEKQKGAKVLGDAVKRYGADIPIPVALQKAPGLHHRVGGALPLRLKSGFIGFRKGGEIALHFLPLKAVHHAERLDSRSPGGVNNPFQHGLIQHPAQHLRQIGFHSLALARGQDNSTNLRHISLLCQARLRPNKILIKS